MRRALTVLAILGAIAATPGRPAEDLPVAFRTLDVYMDPLGAPLAAWQVEVACRDGEGRIAGVEGGEDHRYAGAPWYDPAALQAGRIIIGAFSLDEGTPSGRTRVARLHLIEAGGPGRYDARVMAAAAEGGRRIEAKVDLVPAGGN